MPKIGSFGDLVFEISTKRIQTFKDFQRNRSARWHKHDIILRKPRLEFGGADLEDISLTVVFSIALGVSPQRQLDKLQIMINAGKVAPIILGGKPISHNYWVIESINDTIKEVNNKGVIVSVETTINLKEYAIIKKKVKPKVTVKSKTTNTKSKKTLGTITIKVKSVNIRSGPSTKNKVIGYAYKDKKFTVYSLKNGWYSLGKGKYITADNRYSTLKRM